MLLSQSTVLVGAMAFYLHADQLQHAGIPENLLEVSFCSFAYVCIAAPWPMYIASYASCSSTSLMANLQP